MKASTLALVAVTVAYSAIAAPPPVKWYVLNAAAGECQVATEAARKAGLPYLASPGFFEAMQKDRGNYGGTQIYRADDGSIRSVGITTIDNGLVMAYFPNFLLCEAALMHGIKNGQLHAPGELN
jgi:hypothetical protein